MLSSGEQVGVRELTVDDATEGYASWLNDPEISRFLESRFVEHTVASVREFVQEQADRDDVLMLAIIELETGKHVGNIKVGPLSPHHGTADVGLLIGERSVWGRGYGREAITLATRLGFERMGARKLTASCYSDNVGSANAFRNAGWADEGVRPAQFVGADRSIQDQVMFGILPA